MAIAARRFNFLDHETSIPFSDLLNSNSSDILNSPLNDLKEMKSGVEGFLKKDFDVPGSVKDMASGLKDGASDLIRESKGALGTLKDVTGSMQKDIDGAIGDLFPDNPAVKSAYGKLSQNCRSSGASFAGLGKPYDISMACGAKKTAANKSAKCGSAAFNNVLNAATDGEYNNQARDLNKVLSSLVGLSKMGYDLNMCGVFDVLGAGLSGDLLSRASGSLMGSIGASGNLLGAFDLAKSSAALWPTQIMPGGLKGIFSNMDIPAGFIDADMAETQERLFGSAELFDAEWDKSTFDDMASIEQMGEDYNADLDKLLYCKSTDRVYDFDLDAIPEDNDIFIASAYQSCTARDNFVPSYGGRIQADFSANLLEKW